MFNMIPLIKGKRSTDILDVKLLGFIFHSNQVYVIMTWTESTHCKMQIYIQSCYQEQCRCKQRKYKQLSNFSHCIYGSSDAIPPSTRNAWVPRKQKTVHEFLWFRGRWTGGIYCLTHSFTDSLTLSHLQTPSSRVHS